MKIVVTGSRGFIGSHLIKSLKGHDIIEWDTSIGKDIKYFNLEPDVDFVVHLAGLTSPRDSINEPMKYWEQNVQYSKKIFDMCGDIPMVYASSAAAKEYWRSPYGTTKKVLEELAHSGQIGLRFETIFGNGASDISLIGRIKNGTIKYKTNHIRDFVHIDDVVDCIKMFINFKQYLFNLDNVYEVGTGTEYKIEDVASHFGIDVPLKDGDDVEIFKSVADVIAINKLGWKSKSTIYDS